MNYEELLLSKGDHASHAVRMPVGIFHRIKTDGKFTNCIDVHKSLSDNLMFDKSLKEECERNITIKGGSQLHFFPVPRKDNACTLIVEQGSYKSFSQLLNDTPAVAASTAFINETIKSLFDIATLLHSKDIYHVCFAPDNVFARDGNNRPMLLSHGSFYHKSASPEMLYKGFENYVAPEVIAGEKPDARSDIYSIGKFLEWLFSFAETPYVWKGVLKRATSPAPDKRYQTIDDMEAAVRQRKAIQHSLVTAAIAVAAALLIVGAYFELTPDTTSIEYVKPAPKQTSDDLLDDGFDPMTELGVIPADTASMLTEEEQQRLKEYEKKSEAIFRKQYAKEADRILSDIYNSSYMGSNEKKFIAGSQSTMNELVKIQVDLAKKTNLSDAHSQRIASEIIEELTEKKKKALKTHGIQK